MRTTSVPVHSCPGCGNKLDGATDPFSDLAPQPGDISVCCHCAVALVLTQTMLCRLMRPDELIALTPEQRGTLQSIQHDVTALHRRRGNLE